MEAKLADPSLYNNPEEVKKVNSDFNTTKDELEKSLSEWTNLSERLSEIEKNFLKP